MADKLTLLEIATMSAPRELSNHPDDLVILTVDVAGAPKAELRLTEIYDVATSTLNDDYLLVFQSFIALQLESTHGLSELSRSRLLDARFCTLQMRANGDLISLRKPATERLIQQTLLNRLDISCPVSVFILIKFKTPGFCIPGHLHKSTLIPLNSCEKEPNIVIGSHILAVMQHDHDHDKFDCGLAMPLLQDPNNDAAFTNTTASVNVSVASNSIESNLLEHLSCECLPVSYGNALNPDDKSTEGLPDGSGSPALLPTYCGSFVHTENSDPTRVDESMTHLSACLDHVLVISDAPHKNNDKTEMNELNHENLTMVHWLDFFSGIVQPDVKNTNGSDTLPLKVDGVKSQKNNKHILDASVERGMMRMMYKPIDRGRSHGGTSKFLADKSQHPLWSR